MDIKAHNKLMSDNKEAVSELSNLAQTSDNSITYNKYNGCVQSSRDGEQYISLTDALKFAMEYNGKYVRKKKLSDLLDGTK